MWPRFESRVVRLDPSHPVTARTCCRLRDNGFRGNRISALVVATVAALQDSRAAVDQRQPVDAARLRVLLRRRTPARLADVDCAATVFAGRRCLNVNTGALILIRSDPPVRLDLMILLVVGIFVCARTTTRKQVGH